MVLKKVQKLSLPGTAGVGIPAIIQRETGITAGDFVNVEAVGKEIHIKKVCLD